ncbi:MAG TPA: hypothetical protein DCP91_11490 [Eggerthellaceae bacterium]|nr:hypothetical protein [Eggerthellaceae bacterium]
MSCKQWVAVTGACGGIGSAIVLELVDYGFGVWAIGRDEDALYDAFGKSDTVRTLVCDLSKEAAIASAVKCMVEDSGPLRGLVHCAGFDKLAPLYLAKRRDAEALMAIHVYAAMDLCKQLAKKGRAAEGCSIVLMSSLSAHEGAAGHTAYAAAKGALEGFLPSAACELSARGIRLNELVLGVVRTQMSAGFIDKLDEGQMADLKAGYPLGLGKPEDVAPIVRFLVSDDSRWITGQKLFADGGHSVRSV